MDSTQLPLQVGVKALLKNPDGKYLLLRRNPEKYRETGAKWDIPGGRINLNSPLLENLKREIKEETGLDLTNEPKLVAAQDIIRPDKHVVRLTYVGEISGEPTVDSDHTEAKWFFPAEILQMDVTMLDSFLKELLDKKIVHI